MKSVIRTVGVSVFLASFALASGSVQAHGDEELQNGPMMSHSGKPFGHGADASQASRTVAVTLLDTMRFTPDRIDAEQGEVVRIHVINKGQVDHEFVLGDKEELKAHAEMMKSMPGMVHREANTIRLAPGEEGDVVWAFTESGNFLFVCLIPGHWEAGMQGNITVKAK